MLLSSLLGVVALAAVIDAQTTDSSTFTTSTTTPPASTTSSSAAQTHYVAVGAEGFKYSPNSINASVGDYVVWRFYPGGHTVVRAEYKYPCIPYEDTGPNKVGFYSGQISPDVISDNLPTFSVRINDTAPIFYYCSAAGSCINQHMIGVINPNDTETLDVQLLFAENSTYQLSPGQPFPSETVASSTSSATATPTSSSTASPSSSSSSSGLGGGQIAGIAIGSAAVIVLAGALIYLCGRRGGFDMAYRRSTQTYPPPLVEARFTPQSPGQETFSSAQNRRSPVFDQHTSYHDVSPGMSQFPLSPPLPTSPTTQAVYGSFPSQTNQVHSPLMGGIDDGRGYYDHTPQETPPPPSQSHQSSEQVPVELPTSDDPGNSPLPSYRPGRHFSFAQNSEQDYRPGVKN